MSILSGFCLSPQNNNFTFLFTYPTFLFSSSVSKQFLWICIFSSFPGNHLPRIVYIFSPFSYSFPQFFCCLVAPSLSYTIIYIFLPVQPSTKYLTNLSLSSPSPPSTYFADWLDTYLDNGGNYMLTDTQIAVFSSKGTDGECRPINKRIDAQVFSAALLWSWQRAAAST